MARQRGKSRSGREAGAERLVDQCVTLILEEFKAGRLRPGQRLGEGMLSERLGVGRGPVKAALDQLAYSGLVERRPRSGSYVPSWSLEDYLELLYLRACLESMACRLATLRITGPQLKSLMLKAREVDRMMLRSSLPAAAIVARAELAFHGAIAEASGNRWIRRALTDQRVVAECISTWHQRPQNFVEPSDRPHVDHVQIVEAMRTRDPELAARAMMLHVTASFAIGEQR